MKFAAFEKLLSRAVDTFHGERVLVEPRTGGVYIAGTSDSSRPTFEATAVFGFDPKVITGKRGDGPPLAAAGSLVQVSFITADLPHVPRAGDRIIALERQCRAFAVIVIEPDEFGRTLFRCTPATSDITP